MLRRYQNEGAACARAQPSHSVNWPELTYAGRRGGYAFCLVCLSASQSHSQQVAQRPYGLGWVVSGYRWDGFYKKMGLDLSRG